MFVCFLIQTSILYLDGVGLLFISTETWILEENISYPQAMTLPGLDDKWGITLKKTAQALIYSKISQYKSGKEGMSWPRGGG